MAGPDVLIVGGGPAGAIAGLVAARAGARVRILDRATFPRDKLCGDTVNPGALAILRRLGVADGIDQRGLRVDGMIVTGGGGVTIAGCYPNGLHGRAIVRRDLDAVLLDAAARAGCAIEHGVVVRKAIVAEDRAVSSRERVVGVVASTAADRERRFEAPVIIGADGRRSALAFGLGLARHPGRPRRWAVGAYFAGVRGQTPGLTPNLSPGSESGVLGEMHVRKNCYIGVAPVPGGLTNVCLVREGTKSPQSADTRQSGDQRSSDGLFRDPGALLRHHLTTDPLLRDRFAAARMVGPTVVLGPLAVDTSGGAFDGLLLAGDASGFIDPMTGDGLRFAIRGGELAADAALNVLAHGWDGVHAAHARARAEAFGGKWRFNRMLRTLVASPKAVTAAAAGASLAPAILRAIIARAGDCHVAA